jgi:Phage capsid family
VTTATVDKSRVKELQAALQTKAAEIEGLSNGWKDETGDGKFVLDTKQFKTYQKTVGEAEEIKQLLLTEQTAGGIFEFLSQPEGTTLAGEDAARGARREVKSLADDFLSGDVYAEWKSSDFRTLGGVHAMEVGIADLARRTEVKDVYSAMGGVIEIPGIGSVQNLGWTERTLRPGRVRDLFPAERTNAAMLYGMRMTGFTNNAAVVSERRAADGTSPPTGGATDVFGLKPFSNIEITPITYPLATIAHLIAIHKQTLADEPRLRGLIDRDMIDGIKMVEDSELLYGDGVGDNLTGIVNTPGIQTYTGLSSDKRSAQIRRALTKAILAYFQPTGVVMHPLDWEDIELETDANGAYTIAVSVAVGGEKRVWRLNVVDTPAILEGKYLVGAYGTGAKVYDREQVNIAVSTEHADFFARNALALRAEERIGLVVDRPESFVYGTLTTPV